MWGSNPRIPEPQSGVLTTSPIPPFQKYNPILAGILPFGNTFSIDPIEKVLNRTLYFIF